VEVDRAVSCGRALAVTGVRGQPEVFYLARWAVVFGGARCRAHLKPIFDSQAIARLERLAVAPSNPQIIYVGTGEADMRRHSYGNGMYRSPRREDVGAQGLEDSRQIAAILIDPKDRKKFCRGAGHAYGPNAERGVFYSKDGGKKWSGFCFMTRIRARSILAFEPGNPKTIFAALLQTRRPPWNIIRRRKGGDGLYRSKTAASIGSISGHGLPSEGLGRMGIAFAPSNPRRFTDRRCEEGGLYRSDDGGENWQRISDDKRSGGAVGISAK